MNGVYLGLMSGTSLDGISAAVVRFAADEHGAVSHQLLAARTVAYTDAQRQQLRAALAGGAARDYCRLAFDLGQWLGTAAVAVLADAGVARADVRAVGSHGQTLWHEPPHSTWQVGEPAVIAERTGVAVVSGFRTADVAAGGQGAPLVPMADALLFADPLRWRALQNLGGIGNVTLVPPAGAPDGVRAFDTGPGMMVIDGIVRRLGGLQYDADGAWAARGTPLADVVSALLRDPFFATEPPRSTGRELFGDAYVDRVLEACRQAAPACADADIVATATLLTARSIADALARFAPEPVTELLVSGGGAHNATLLRMLAAELPELQVRRFSDEYYDGEAKEAVAFALLAFLHLSHRAGNVARATGARGPRVLGMLTPAP
jgi:anhydro-N-acetylmuramic acid kinase